jgi:hypothetical protein
MLGLDSGGLIEAAHIRKDYTRWGASRLSCACSLVLLHPQAKIRLTGGYAQRGPSGLIGDVHGIPEPPTPPLPLEDTSTLGEVRR